MYPNDRKKAFAAAKSAVHVYARDPSDRHAADVQAAWKVVKDLESSSFWRQWRSARLMSSDSTDRND